MICDCIDLLSRQRILERHGLIGFRDSGTDLLNIKFLFLAASFYDFHDCPLYIVYVLVFSATSWGVLYHPLAEFQTRKMKKKDFLRV